jgi:methylglyoxal synthase
MTHKKIAMEHDKKVALVAHDNKKQDLVEWAKYPAKDLSGLSLLSRRRRGDSYHLCKKSY